MQSKSRPSRANGGVARAATTNQTRKRPKPSACAADPTITQNKK